MSSLVKDKKILIIHFRVGKTDGVSLEIASWQKILISKGADVKLCSGPENIGADFVIEDLEQQLNSEIFTIDEDAFGGLKTYKSDEDLVSAIKEKQSILYDEFYQVIRQCKPDLIIVSNMFSVGENLPAIGALYQALDKLAIPTLAIHHDFYWYNKRYLHPTNNFVREQLEKYFPPQARWLKHACINSLSQQALLTKKGIKAILIYDTFDFKQAAWQKKNYIRQLLEGNGIGAHDLVINQATRIVRMKNIELAIDFVRILNLKRNKLKLATKTLYDGRRFDPKIDQIVLLLSGYAEFRDQVYLNQLLAYASKCNVQLHLTRELVDNASHKRGVEKIHALWDIYPFADLVTYPSEYEGFGNQFLEAVFARKPVALFEYPVWSSDLKPKGFEAISMGTELQTKPDGLVMVPKTRMNQAVNKAIELLTDKDKYNRLVENNYQIGKQNFSFENTGNVFEQVFESLVN